MNCAYNTIPSKPIMVTPVSYCDDLSDAACDVSLISVVIFGNETCPVSDNELDICIVINSQLVSISALVSMAWLEKIYRHVGVLRKKIKVTNICIGRVGIKNLMFRL